MVDLLITLFTKVGQVEGVTVTSPYDVEGQINTSRTTAFASIDATIRSQSALITLGEEIRDIGKPYETGDLRIEYGGNIFAGFELPASEAYGLLAAIIILVLAFGSVLAMGLPIGTALVGLGVGASLVTVLSHVLPMPDFTTSLVAMIGLGVGIDYALFSGAHRVVGIRRDHVLRSRGRVPSAVPCSSRERNRRDACKLHHQAIAEADSTARTQAEDRDLLVSLEPPRPATPMDVGAERDRRATPPRCTVALNQTRLRRQRQRPGIDDRSSRLRHARRWLRPGLQRSTVHHRSRRHCVRSSRTRVLRRCGARRRRNRFRPSDTSVEGRFALARHRLSDDCSTGRGNDDAHQDLAQRRHSENWRSSQGRWLHRSRRRLRRRHRQPHAAP
ncbi:MAG: hypothetical protein EBT21_07505, partial [Actinobacteria bacterium]|nr:hypothetical protein [Actinomycetota bacterium]